MKWSVDNQSLTKHIDFFEDLRDAEYAAKEAAQKDRWNEPAVVFNAETLEIESMFVPAPDLPLDLA